MNQNPFNLYDFLGYLIPGILCLVIIQFAGFIELSIFEGLKISGSEWLDLIIIIVVAYTLGHLLSIVSSRTIEDYYVWRNGYPSKNLFVQSHSVPKITWYMAIVFLFIWPVVLVDALFRKLFAFRFKNLQPALKKIVLKKFVQFFSVIDKKVAKKIKKEKYLCDELFRYVNHYANENSREHKPKFQNYVALYGFTRSICLLFCLVVGVELMYVIWKVSTCKEVIVTDFGLLISSWGIGYVFYLAYAKFFRRFSLEVIMVFAANYHPSKK